MNYKTFVFRNMFSNNFIFYWISFEFDQNFLEKTPTLKNIFQAKFKAHKNWALNLKLQDRFSSERPKVPASRNSAGITKEVFEEIFVTEKSCFRGQVKHSMWRLCKRKLPSSIEFPRQQKLPGKNLFFTLKINLGLTHTHTPTIIMTKNKLFKIM